MAVYTIKVGTDAQVIAVTNVYPGLRAEVRSATTTRDAIGIIERRLPSPSPTIEFERALALRAIDATTHLTPTQKATARAQILAADEADKIVFDGPYPLPDRAEQLDQDAVRDGAPPKKKPLVIVFIDP